MIYKEQQPIFAKPADFKTSALTNILKLGQLYLPTIIDFNEDRKKIKPHQNDLVTFEDSENIECTLTFNFCRTSIYIDYYCEGNTYLSKSFNLKNGCIASGNIAEESFEKIQKRVLNVLSQYMEDPKKVMELYQ